MGLGTLYHLVKVAEKTLATVFDKLVNLQPYIYIYNPLTITSSKLACLQRHLHSRLCKQGTTKLTCALNVSVLGKTKVSQNLNFFIVPAKIHGQKVWHDGMWCNMLWVWLGSSKYFSISYSSSKMGPNSLPAAKTECAHLINTTQPPPTPISFYTNQKSTHFIK